MAKGLSRDARESIKKCKEAAIAAVEVYNRPGPRFRTAHFVILIVVAWTALFHAVSYKKGVKPWYKKKGKKPKGDRYIRIDGDPKHWELSECLRQHYAGDNPPERKNLEFLIGLRNKIEHRSVPELDAGLYGECQASLMNLEETLVREFGEKHALMEQLVVSLQFSQLVPSEKRKAAKIVANSAARTVRDYVDKFRTGLPSSTLNSMKYSFSVFLVPKVANKENLADTVVEFVKIDETNREELSRMEKLNVLIKEKHIPIANLDLYKPSQVATKVQAKLPHKFSVHAHSGAWHHYKVRPAAGAPKPAATDSRYCVFDSAHSDYLYTEAWIEKLAGELSDSGKFEEVTGMAATPK